MANETVAGSGAASKVSRWTIGNARAALCILLLAGAMEDAHAQTESCPLAGQNPMIVVQMFFGLSVPHRGPVTAEEWNSFLKQTVTPRFPEGFTVYDASWAVVEPGDALGWAGREPRSFSSRSSIRPLRAQKSRKLPTDIVGHSTSGPWGSSRVRAAERSERLVFMPSLSVFGRRSRA